MHLFISYLTIFSLTNNLAFLLNFLSQTFLFIFFECHVDCPKVIQQSEMLGMFIQLGKVKFAIILSFWVLALLTKRITTG